MKKNPAIISSRIMTFIYKHFFLIITGSLILPINILPVDGFILPHILLLIVLVIYTFLCLFLFNIDVYDDYIIIHRFFRKTKVKYKTISNIYQTRFIAPKLITITFKKKRPFLNKFIFCIMPLRSDDIILIKDEPIVKYIKERFIK